MSATLQDSGYGVKIGKGAANAKNRADVTRRIKRDEKYFGKPISINGKPILIK